MSKSSLTPREAEIAHLTAQCASPSEIARTLHLAPSTVRNALQRVYDKLRIEGSNRSAKLIKHLEHNRAKLTLHSQSSDHTIAATQFSKEVADLFQVDQLVQHKGSEWFVAGPDVDGDGNIGLRLYSSNPTDEQVESCEVPTTFVSDLTTVAAVAA